MPVSTERPCVIFSCPVMPRYVFAHASFALFDEGGANGAARGGEWQKRKEVHTSAKRVVYAEQAGREKREREGEGQR
jgi:hypothetical protein